MDKWSKVYATGKFHEAEIVKAVLEKNGIQSVILNKKDSSYHFGYFEIHVKQGSTIKAIKIIQDDVRFG